MTDTGGRRGSVRKDTARGSWYVIADVAEVGALQRKQVRRRGFATEREAHRALTSAHWGRATMPKVAWVRRRSSVHLLVHSSGCR